MRFQPLERLINLLDNYSRQFKIDSLSLLLIQRHGEVFLIESHCPHRAQPLDVASIDGMTITCPAHRYQFSIGDGSLIYASEDPCRALKIFELVYEGNELGLMLPDHL